MSYHLSIQPYQLRFRFDARTSRGAMSAHQVYYLVLKNQDKSEVFGIGECAPLPGLSPDFENIADKLSGLKDYFNTEQFTSEQEVDQFIQTIDAGKFPSVRFAFETAALDLINGARRVLFHSEFTDYGKGIPINGLIWMGEKEWMQKQIIEKVDKGFSTIKLKIGALNFEDELDLLRWMRREYSTSKLSIRVDANGAFSPYEAMSKLQALEPLNLHSIEQPIKAGQREQMAELCEKSPVPIALDEELIGNQKKEYKKELLQVIKPPFLILKPTLHGGLASCAEWIELALKERIGWWMTSALESNIGLNAVSQFTATYRPDLPQGLGTGQLYENNIPSPLEVKNGGLYFNTEEQWRLENINHQDY